MNTSENYMNQMPLPNSQKSGGVGAVIAVIIIIAVLAFGGYYFWQQIQDRKMMNDDQTVNSELQSTTTDGINAELDADLRAMQNDDVGQSDMQQVDGEFQQ